MRLCGECRRLRFLAFAVSETDDVADDASETSSSAPDVALVPAETLVVVPGEFNNTGTNPSSPSPPGFAGRGGGGGGSSGASPEGKRASVGDMLGGAKRGRVVDLDDGRALGLVAERREERAQVDRLASRQRAAAEISASNVEREM